MASTTQPVGEVAATHPPAPGSGVRWRTPSSGVTIPSLVTTPRSSILRPPAAGASATQHAPSAEFKRAGSTGSVTFDDGAKPATSKHADYKRAPISRPVSIHRNVSLSANDRTAQHLTAGLRQHLTGLRQGLVGFACMLTVALAPAL